MEGLREEMAERGKTDLHWFAWMACGFRALTPADGFHGRLCSFLDQATPVRKWVEVFRGATKSTLASVALPLRSVVVDPREHVLIVSAVEDLARSFVGQIMEIVEHGETFRWLYPEVRPHRKRAWSERGASIERPDGIRGTVREASWTAGSVQKGLTGGHYTRRHYDDLVIDANVGTRDAARKVIDTFVSWRPLRAGVDDPEVMCSTPYADYDLSAWLKREQPRLFTRLSIPVRWPDDDTGELAWPEEFPHHELDALKSLDFDKYMAQMMLQPLPPETQTFKREWFRYWRTAEEFEAEGQRGSTVVDPRRLTCYMGVDPGTGTEGGDPSAIVVVGVDEGRRYYVLEALEGCWETSYLMDMLFLMWRKWPVERTWVEMAGPFAALASTLKAEMEARGEWQFVEKANVGNERKPQRIRLTLAPCYHGCVIHHHFSHQGQALEQQLLRFRDRGGADTGLPHDDLLDAFSYAMRLARDFGSYGRARDEQVEFQLRSGFGLWEKTAHTLDEIGAQVPKAHLKLLSEGGSDEAPRKKVAGVGLW